MTQSGRQDRLIIIERPVKGGDPDYGTETVTWVPLEAEAGSPTVPIPFYAEVEDVLPSRSESVTLGLQVARNQTRIRMRYRNDVTSECRVTIVGDGDEVPDRLCSIVGGPAEIGGRRDRIEFVVERYSS